MRYVLIASPELFLLLSAIGMSYGETGLGSLFGKVTRWSFLMWVPLESLAYIHGCWAIVRWDAFSSNRLPFLILLLSIWSVIAALLAALVVLLIRLIRPERKAPA